MTPPLGRCRVCDQPSWKTDDTGPIHGCCLFLGRLCRYCRESNPNEKAKLRRPAPDAPGTGVG